MYIPIPPQVSRARAWLEATKIVNAHQDHEGYNVIIDVLNPHKSDETDGAIEREVDGFLRSNARMPVRSVANTIFPQAVYERHGRPAFYDVYLKDIFPRLRRSSNDWGRYFERLVQLPDKQHMNPLDDVVVKMREQISSDRTYKNIYEMNLYDPIRDAKRVMGRQCLSFLSLKITSDNALNMTAIYRNHYYIERLLGNLVGLTDLMRFVAKETTASVGQLTIVSTHAQVDSPGKRQSLTDLLKRCDGYLKKSAVESR